MASWRAEEEEYLRNLEMSCVELSREYHSIYFKLKTTQNKFKIPAIIIGSFTGVASFGSSTFPQSYQKWISVSVGLINVAIAILTTLESFFKLGEDLNASRTCSEQLKKLAEDINREMSLDVSTRQTSGIIFLRDVYTRYQQILSTAPVLQSYYISHIIIPKTTEKLSQKLAKVFLDRRKTSENSSEFDLESGKKKHDRIRQLKEMNDYSVHKIPSHLNLMDTIKETTLTPKVNDSSSMNNTNTNKVNVEALSSTLYTGEPHKVENTPQEEIENDNGSQTSTTLKSLSIDKLNKFRFKQLAKSINYHE